MGDQREREFLSGPRVKLVRFSSRNITPDYMSWINDQTINRHLETGRIPVLREEVFIPDPRETMMFAITVDTAYIGTCTIHNIDWISRKAQIGYMIGNKDYCKNGIATETADLLVDYAFNRLGLNKLNASALRSNVGSVRVLEKNGFDRLGEDPMDYFIDGEWIDNLLYVRIRK